MAGTSGSADHVTPRGQDSFAALDSEASAGGTSRRVTSLWLSEPALSHYSRSGSRYLPAGSAVGSSAPAVEPWAERVSARRLWIAEVVLILTELLTESVQYWVLSRSRTTEIGRVRCCPEAGDAQLTETTAGLLNHRHP